MSRGQYSQFLTFAIQRLYDGIEFRECFAFSLIFNLFTFQFLKGRFFGGSTNGFLYFLHISLLILKVPFSFPDRSMQTYLCCCPIKHLSNEPYIASLLIS